jgi:hypothetical protein
MEVVRSPGGHILSWLFMFLYISGGGYLYTDEFKLA